MSRLTFVIGFLEDKPFFSRITGSKNEIRCPYKSVGRTGSIESIEEQPGFLYNWDPMRRQATCNVCSSLFMGDPLKISKLKLTPKDLSTWKIKQYASGARFSNRIKLTKDEAVIVRGILDGRIDIG